MKDFIEEEDEKNINPNLNSSPFYFVGSPFSSTLFFKVLIFIFFSGYI